LIKLSQFNSSLTTCFGRNLVSSNSGSDHSCAPLIFFSGMRYRSISAIRLTCSRRKALRPSKISNISPYSAIGDSRLYCIKHKEFLNLHRSTNKKSNFFARFLFMLTKSFKNSLCFLSLLLVKANLYVSTSDSQYS